MVFRFRVADSVNIVTVHNSAAARNGGKANNPTDGAMGTLQHPPASNIKAIATSSCRDRVARATVDRGFIMRIASLRRHKGSHAYAFYIITEAKLASRSSQSFSILYSLIFPVLCCIPFCS